MQTGLIYLVVDGVATRKTVAQLNRMGIQGNVLNDPRVYVGEPQYTGTNKGDYSNVGFSFEYNDTHDRVDEIVSYTDVSLESAKITKTYALLDDAVLRESSFIVNVAGTDYYYIGGQVGIDDIVRTKLLSDDEGGASYKMVNQTVTGGEPDEGTAQRREHTSAEVKAVMDDIFNQMIASRDVKDALQVNVDAATTVDEVIAV
ncbi:MAG: hypothetical protein DRI46_10670 [Chloroflexi bacterium]|nr:MAG: hypothetical protein DRI46_10670 [Chloroflexota bacterium]